MIYEIDDARYRRKKTWQPKPFFDLSETFQNPDDKELMMKAITTGEDVYIFQCPFAQEIENVDEWVVCETPEQAEDAWDNLFGDI